ELAARVGVLGAAPALVILPMWAHGFLMVYGLFTFFIFGFLFTVFPRWMGGPPIASRQYVPAFSALIAGILAIYIGLFTRTSVLAAGLALYLVGWIFGVAVLLGAM